MSKRNAIYRLRTGHRGRLTGIQDQVKLGIYARGCEVCGKTITRKQKPQGRFEQWEMFFKRKTCGRLPNGKYTECMRINTLKEKNSHWKTGRPVCRECGKELASYPSSNTKAERCMDCNKKHLSDVWHDTHFVPKGIYPEHLKQFGFKKGMTPHNKSKIQICQIENCNNKYCAKGLCGKHYQQQKNRTT